MSQSSSRKAYSSILIASLLIGFVLSAVLFKTTESAHYEELDKVGEERLNLYASTIEAEYQRFEYLPFIVANDHQVLELIDSTENSPLTEQVNRKLESWRAESKADALYLMDNKGVVIASSNWDKSGSFMGHDYHFRPYFIDAIEGHSGRFFAVGVTTGRPGLFLSRPVYKDETIQGVAVLKVDMSSLETNWNLGGEQVWVSDSEDVIFLASNPQWRYRSLSILSPEVVNQLEEAKKYSHHRIEPLAFKDLPLSPQGKRVIQLSAEETRSGNNAVGPSYLLHKRDITELGWSLYYLSDLKGLEERKTGAMLISALATALLAVVGMFVLSRFRHQQQLEWRVEKRTAALNQSNTQLKLEVEERVRTEKALRQTHEELIQAEKLGALGHISAELVHEISQPLQATLTFIASTKLLIERQQYELAQENLQEIDKLLHRVSGIVTHLKTFSSKSRGVLSTVELQRVIDNALLVMNARIEKSGVELIWTPSKAPISVKADEIKLEQVLINLIRNALDAIQISDSSGRGKVEISLTAENHKAIIEIHDNGCGINSEHLPKLFEPFFTTKSAGEGMGLGLSVSYGIVEEFGGRLEAFAESEKGTTFRVTLAQSSPQPRSLSITESVYEQ
ncbi:ATP-binding protein [Vibrio sp. HN007]|uniref:sensor histidine kinase n=1 Tax=Vibrio iocasae TaxID=3098914 RepID=UPI0035D4D9BE